MSTDTKWESLQEIGRGAMESIAEMVAALNCDYDRLEELRDERESLVSDLDDSDNIETTKALADWDAENGAELQELTEAAGDCESREDAEQRIQEDPLSLEFRSGWVSSRDEMEPEEFCLLLSTGGPAVRIIGEVRDGEPHRPVLQAQDWGTMWTEYMGADRDVLMDYCRVFCMEF